MESFVPFVFSESDKERPGSLSSKGTQLDEFTSISADVSIMDIDIVSGDEYSISYSAHEKLVPKFEVKNSCLEITQKPKKLWGNKTCSVTITVEPAKSAVSDKTEDTAADAYSEVRQELVRLINQTRAANGVSELPVNDALMSAAQACSDRRYTWHHTKEECEAVIASGYPHGFGTNLTVFTGVAAKDTAQHALENWISSSGHFETMIEPDCDGIGVGVTESGGVTYCYMFVGRPNTQNPYE